MPTSAAGARCKCCAGSDLEAEATVVSPFVAFKAWGGRPEPVSLFSCKGCGFKFYSRSLSDDEARAYYDGYRDDSYCEMRNRFEPFYTRAVHDQLARWLSSQGRRADLAHALSLAGVASGFDDVLDFGGGTGTLLRDIDAARKAVFDLSGGAVESGIELVSDLSGAGRWNFVTCAQVLEHVSDPQAMLGAIKASLRPLGIVYLEVPDQLWRSWRALRAPRWWMKFLCRQPAMLLAADIYSTFFRVKLGRLPPFGFVPMREHVNFFTLRALSALATGCGFSVLSEGRNAGGSFFVVARMQGET